MGYICLIIDDLVMAVVYTKQPKSFDFFGFLKLVRFKNLLIIVFTQYMVKFFLIDEKTGFWQSIFHLPLFCISLATVLTASAGYIINDYYDVKIDAINKPDRVIVGKTLKRRVVLGWHFILSFSAILCVCFISLRVALLVFFSGFLLWFYSNQLKRLPLIGNVTVALLTSLSLCILSIYFVPNRDLVLIFSVFAFFISLIREIVKDMEDVEGDADYGCKTLPVLWGIRKSKKVIYVFLLILAVILISTYLTFPHRFTFYLYLTVLPMLFWFSYQLFYADKKSDFTHLSNFTKLIMLMGVLSMVLV